MEEVLKDLDVSRETLDMLTRYDELLHRWNPKINLVSKATLDQSWWRHVVDSVQIVDILPSWDRWADLGSGGGFPGLVVAILAKSNRPEASVTLVESDLRKTAFLRTVIRDLKLSATVHAKRIETLDPLEADVISARALADLSKLLEYAARHLHDGGSALFMKGSSWAQEVEAARKTWSFSLVVHESRTDPSAAVLEVKEIRRV
jgi:16S rRNA (guanine527-N7)-methyltransferase